MLSWPESARLTRATVAPILAPAEKERSLGLRSSLRSLRRCRSDRSLAHLPGYSKPPGLLARTKARTNLSAQTASAARLCVDTIVADRRRPVAAQNFVAEPPSKANGSFEWER